jgi:hypothetical protein
VTRRILVAPAGSRFSADAGSEDGWIYEIVTGAVAAAPDLHFTCVAERVGGARPCDGVRPVAIGPRRTEELGGLLLPFRVARATGGAIGLGDVDLLHHALPFGVGRTFSLLADQAHRRGVPVVIGPVQTPLEWIGPDEEGGQLQGRGAPRLRRTATAAAARTWTLVGSALARISARTLRQADRVVVVGDPAKRLVEMAGVDPARIEIIPPPTRVLWTGWAPSRGSTALRLVTAGYLIERKAVDDVVNVVADLAAAGEPVVLDIAGDGPAAVELQALAHLHPGGGAIRFHGWLERSKLAELVGAADAYVSMSRGESWGQAAADALASALVVVTATNDGARSMAGLGAPVRLVPVGDRRRLADELRQLCHLERQTLQQLGVAGARWATKHISTTVVAQKWVDVYRGAIERASAPTRPRTVESSAR